MSREHIAYGSSAHRPMTVAGAIDVTTPVAGFYRHRLGSGTVAGGVRIWFGPPHDPVTGEELDRSWRWQAEFDGEAIEFDRVWPVCADEPLTEPEYRRRISRKAWARQYAPDSAYAESGRKIDLLSTDMPLPF